MLHICNIVEGMLGIERERTRDKDRQAERGGDAWSCGQDGRAKRWNPRFASLPVEGITVSGLIPADKSGHVGYAPP